MSDIHRYEVEELVESAEERARVFAVKAIFEFAEGWVGNADAKSLAELSAIRDLAIKHAEEFDG